MCIKPKENSCDPCPDIHISPNTEGRKTAALALFSLLSEGRQNEIIVRATALASQQ